MTLRPTVQWAGTGQDPVLEWRAMPVSTGGGKHALLGEAARSLVSLLTWSVLLTRLLSGLPADVCADRTLRIECGPDSRAQARASHPHDSYTSSTQ